MPIRLSIRTKTYTMLSLLDQKYGVPAIRAYDVYYPDIADLTQQPIVLFIHGGGWISGTKSDVTSHPDTRAALARLGYVVYSINYRLGPTFVHPDHVTDVQGFLGFLGAGGGIGNKNNIIVTGDSAGAHLGMLVGIPPNGTWVDSENPSTDYTITGIVSESGPTDIGALYLVTDIGGQNSIRVGLLGYVPATNPSGALNASPINYVASSIPWLLMQSGSADVTVVPQQSLDMLNALVSAGATKASRLLYTGFDHAAMGVSGQVDLDRQAFIAAYAG